jgi:hypothetical protein
MSRQFRSDDTSKWLEGYGNGSLGNYSSSGNINIANLMNYVNVTAGTSGTNSLTLGSSGNPGNFLQNTLVVIRQLYGTGVGGWELNKISNNNGFPSGGGAITMAYPLQNNYTAGTIMMVLAPFMNFTLNTAHTLTVTNWDGTTHSFLPILCNGTCTITGLIDGVGRGFRGGVGSVGVNGGNSLNGFRGEGEASDNQTRQGTANGIGGGGGNSIGSFGDLRSGAGGGGYATVGVTGGIGQNSTGGAGGNSII